MANKSDRPGQPQGEPIESRRAAAAPSVDSTDPAGDDSAGADQTSGTEDEGVLGMPDMGEFSAESARQTPLDDIAEAERDKLPKD